MGSTNKTKERSLYSIRDGAVVFTRKDGGHLTLPSIEGNLVGIHIVSSQVGAMSFPHWYMDFTYGSKEFSVHLPYLSGSFKGIVMALAEDESLSPNTIVKLSPYEKEEQTKVIVRTDGEVVTPHTALPPIGLRTWDGEKYVSEQMKYIESLVDRINQRLGYQ